MAAAGVGVGSSRRVARVLCRALPAALALALLCAPAHASAAPLDRATAAVVAITAGSQRVGSGVVVAPGFVLTAAHVIDAVPASVPERILVENQLQAFTVAAIDRARDLALLRVPLPADVVPIAWGDSTRLARGQQVIVLGFPLGLKQVSLTQGVVSSPLQSYNGAEYIQTDAAINPGSSGGALVDSQGRLVGINVAKIAGQDVGGIGFAVPEADAFAFVRQYAPVAAAAPASSPAIRWWLVALAALVLVAVFAPLAVFRHRHPKASAEDVAPAHERRRFRVDEPGATRTLDLRVPAVAGSAHNADIRIQEPEVAEYQVRFVPGVGGGVTALSLVAEGGMYCGDACVLEAMLRPGESVRVGQATITLLEREDA